jgi:hypothetical protein
MATPMFRSALRRLFRVSASNVYRRGEEIGETVLAAPHGLVRVRILYHGLTLGQYDLDVLLAMLAHAEAAGVCKSVIVSRAHLLMLMGRTDCKDNYAALDASIERLWTAQFSLVDHRGKDLTPWKLLERSTMDNLEGSDGMNVGRRSGKLCYVVGGYLPCLFGLHQWVSVDRLVRAQIKGPGEQLARWLHAYLLTHSPKPHTIELDQLYRMCGAKCQDTEFRDQLKMACRLLKALRLLEEFEISRWRKLGQHVPGTPAKWRYRVVLTRQLRRSLAQQTHSTNEIRACEPDISVEHDQVIAVGADFMEGLAELAIY